ncbi:MAG: TonB-dependent receptor plug domain-containing protein [Syntrophobacteraceae bacterium]
MRRMNRAILTVLVLGAAFCGPLYAQTYELPSVVVTPTMTERSPDSAPGSVQVIDRKEIESLGAETAADVLRYATGAEMLSGTGRSEGLSIRGLGAQRTLVLLDGRRMSLGYKATFDVNQIPTTMIDHIEIVRGPGSALYGSDAIGGVVNIITRKPPHAVEAEVDVRGGGGESAERSGEGVIGGGFGPLRANIAASHFEKDGWDGDGELPDDIDDTSLDAVLSRAVLDLDSSHAVSAGGEWSAFSREGQRLYLNKERTYDADDKRRGGFVQYDFAPKEGPFNAMLRAYGNRYEGSPHFTPTADESDENRELLQAEARGSYSIGNLLTLTGGGEFREETLDGGDLTLSMDDEKSRNAGAVFLQGDWRPLERLNIVAGVRFDDYEESGSHVTPRVVASLFIPYGRVWAGYGQGFKAPTLDQLYGKTKTKGGNEIYNGNEDLDPETSQGCEAGVELRKDWAWCRVTGFYNHLEDMIDAELLSKIGKTYTYTWKNVDEARTAGAEMEAGVQLPMNVALSGNMTYLTTENEETGFDLAQAPTWKGGVTLSWRIPSWGVETRLHYLYFGDSEDGEGNSLDSYNTVNLYASKTLTEHLRLYAGVDNIFDERNEDYTISPVQVYGGLKMTF